MEGDPRRADSVMQERIARLERLSTLLDSAFEVPGTGFRIGWDTIVGLIPGVGDLATAAVSTYILQQAHQIGVSRFTLMRMTANVVVDALVGGRSARGRHLRRNLDSQPEEHETAAKVSESPRLRPRTTEVDAQFGRRPEFGILTVGRSLHAAP